MKSIKKLVKSKEIIENQFHIRGTRQEPARAGKITKKQVEYAIQKLKDNQQITMKELAKIIKKKYKIFDITSQHLGKVIRDNNKTRKRTRHEHFPSKRYGKDVDKKKELDKFYKEVISRPKVLLPPGKI